MLAKNNKWPLIMVIVMSTQIWAQKTETVSRMGGSDTKVQVLTTNPISLLIDTGRYEPKSNCNKAVDGCFPLVWTATNEFRVDEPIWLKVTAENHSELTATEYYVAEIPLYIPAVTMNGTETAPKLTADGCRLYPSLCPPPTTVTEATTIFGGQGGYIEIPPGASDTSFVEVTRLFQINSPGKYNISVRSDGFNLTTKDNFDGTFYRDETRIKRSPGMRSREAQIIVTR